MDEQTRLSAEELDVLREKFGLSLEPSPQAANIIRPARLLEAKPCAACLDELTPVLGSPSRMITASQFSKRYAQLLAAPLFYAMTIYNKGLDLSVNHCHLEVSAPAGGRWSSRLLVTELQVDKPAAIGLRSSWRERLAEHFFVGHLSRVWHALAEAACVPKAILWENTAVRLFSLYEKKLGPGKDAEENRRISEDFHYLVHEAPGYVFGEKKNPLTAFYTPKLQGTVSGNTRVRHTCCFYYELAGGEYCSNCPKARDHRQK
ncbi:Fe-S protein [Paenibacillus oralis]|uniref:Fe-S protein n=1 Tax=Paenibacillus oralis TaxID=2490856 RepID=A0A3P3UDU7_9BACL|nr:IucA/IucC family C-terminal-domain containing protein [Paenibacillus oralis]RRJ67798.1 Fe-S protein [Paenibacillus oralis]